METYITKADELTKDAKQHANSHFINRFSMPATAEWSLLEINELHMLLNNIDWDVTWSTHETNISMDVRNKSIIQMPFDGKTIKNKEA